jgi:hypothetical protein
VFAARLGDALVGAWPTAATGALRWYVTLDIAVVNDLSEDTESIDLDYHVSYAPN